MKEYNHKKIEKKWQDKWEKENFYQAEDFSDKPKKYILVEFPYPSGDGLHVGHARSYTALDVMSRKMHMQGDNVLYPIGWDAFGLPAENFAIKKGIHPSIAVEKNIANFKRQLKSLGVSFDWSREINTTDPKYYKWTQWIFLKFLGKGLAYQKEMPINWCPSCKIGLANEEVIDGKCERCGHETEKRKIKQWMLKITEYADKLLEDLNKVDYLDKIKIQQENWIGRSEGAEVDFEIAGEKVTVFTTRPDTLFGCTYMVLSPEHDLIKKLKDKIENIKEVEEHIDEARKKTEIERSAEDKEKTGIKLEGVMAVNPANNKEIPVFIADYVLVDYGTGAIMAVPAHDKRDFEFAKKYGLDIVEVISGGEPQKEAYSGEGLNVNSDFLDGLETNEAKEKIIKWLQEKNIGKKAVNYKLRDWIFSRQHYWGEPIPVIHCDKCGIVPVKEKDLPVELPYVEKYEPTETGESPLAAMEDWVNTKCPKCGSDAKRETDTMPNWAGSSWYFLRYIDPQNNEKFVDEEKLKYWLPVDLYNGGMEHTTLHLLYSRFWHKFLYDQGLVPTSEPYASRRSHGMILAEDGKKMSKSLGNVINPDEIVEKVGADTLRVYEMFMGPFNQAIGWNTDSVIGVHRFLKRVWILKDKVNENVEENKEVEKVLHQSIKKVTEDIDNMKFNTAVAQLMILVNELEKQDEISIGVYKKFIVLLTPFAPHITEELWVGLPGNKEAESIFKQPWPEYDDSKIEEGSFELVIQINGKFKGGMVMNKDMNQDDTKREVLENDRFKKYFEDKEIKKIIFVKNKLINFVL